MIQKPALEKIFCGKKILNETFIQNTGKTKITLEKFRRKKGVYDGKEFLPKLFDQQKNQRYQKRQNSKIST